MGMAFVLSPAAAESAEDMTDEQVAEAREEALAKLEKPLEKMKVKELLALMEERGVECQKCQGAEKSHIVTQAREAIHLPKVDKKEKEKKEEEPLAVMTDEEVAAAREEALAK